MDNLLYYPYINMPRADWTIRSLIYYDQIGSIVPHEYFYEPEHYETFMLELVRNELVIPLDPMAVLDRPRELLAPFIEYISSKKFNLDQRKRNFQNGNYGIVSESKFKPNGFRIHSSKFDEELFYQLMQAGLARRDHGDLFVVEDRTASDMMSYLASILGKKLNYLPATDIKVRKVPFTGSEKIVYKTKTKENARREVILKELIPFPEQIDLSKVRKFKDEHHDLLKRFKNKIELISLDQSLDEESQLFKEIIIELNLGKEEISAKMNENRFGQVIFGTICGITGAVIGLASAGPVGGAVGSFSALPSFANAIHSALQSEGVETMSNQSGMKYLALIDKKLKK